MCALRNHQPRAADTARWRERLHRGAAVYPVEVDGTTFDLMELCRPWGMVLPGSAADLGKLIADDTEKWGKAIKFSGAKPE
jgi:hypothetical protein